MPTIARRRALAATAVALLAFAGAACGGDDDATNAGGTSPTTAGSGTAGGGSGNTRFNPDEDDALVTLCDGYFGYMAESDPAFLEDINLAADVIGGLDEVRDASFFLIENPDPSDPETQTQAEDARTILQTDIEEAGLCDDVPVDGEETGDGEPPEGEETGDGEPTEGDLALAMCDEWANFATTGDTASLETILDNAEVIGLDADTVDAVSYLLDDPDGSGDQEQHEAAISLGDEGFLALCG